MVSSQVEQVAGHLPGPAGQPSVPHLRIEPSKGWFNLKLDELWQYRELVYFLIWRDIKIRYKQTLLGAAWAIVQPVFTMLVFTLFFGKLAKIPTDGVPPHLFYFAGLVPWQFFAQGLAQSSDSLVGQQNLIKKVYFPRLAIPIGTVCATMVDFAIAFCVLLVLLLSSGVTPTANIIWLPAFVLLSLVTALGVGLWLSSLNVNFRDVKYVVPFLTQFWMFITPIAYPSSLLPEKYRLLYGLNPMTGVVEGFRWALLGTNTQPGPMVAVSATAAVLVFVGGLFYFRRMERSFADVV
jgi:lipopolysaccharide transport system permease protein